MAQRGSTSFRLASPIVVQLGGGESGPAREWAAPRSLGDPDRRQGQAKPEKICNHACQCLGNTELLTIWGDKQETSKGQVKRMKEIRKDEALRAKVPFGDESRREKRAGEG
jgi:hypothetical protein